MTTGYLYAPRGSGSPIKKNTIRFFTGPDLLKKLDEQRLALIKKFQPEQSSIYRTSMLNKCRSLHTYVIFSGLYAWYKLESGADEKMKDLTSEDVIKLIEELDYKSPF